MRLNLDIIDRKILAYLQEDARTTLTKIAKKLYVTRNAIRYRIELMEKQGIIKGYTTEINPLLSENSILVIILLDVKPANTVKCVKILKGFDEVFEIFRLSSGTAIMIKAFFKNAHHQNKFVLQKIQDMPIENYTIHTVAQIVDKKGIPIQFLE
jgi:DNA-binding Lrp family transcriptional regulator